MVLGIISDVHANLIALEAVLQKLKKYKVDQIICLGDLVGYGPSPNEVIERVREMHMVCTLGGADEKIAFEFAASRQRHGVADQTIAWAKEHLTAENITFLRTLPVQARLMTPTGRLRFFHSNMHSPNQSTNFNMDEPQLIELLEHHRCKILAVGKTHVPAVKHLPNGCIINPGSVGLTLNGEPGADFAMLRFKEDKVEVVMDKVEYNYLDAAFEVYAWELPPIIAQALKIGQMPKNGRNLQDIRIQGLG